MSRRTVHSGASPGLSGVEAAVLCCMGDLVEDIVVWLSADIATATDTAASIRRRRGGSAANVAMSAATTGAAVRFIGRVGDDAIGTALISEMATNGIDTRVQQRGRTGTIVVLVDVEGERSMLPDRAAATELTGVDSRDLDGVTWLHVPAYSLVVEPLAATSRLAIRQVQSTGGSVSIDVSSVAIISQMGEAGFSEMIADLAPDVVFCNADEGAALNVAESNGLLGARLTVVKAGAGDAVAYEMAEEVARAPATPMTGLRDTTGAGDAFAAGFITARMGSSDVAHALATGHEMAAQVLALHSA